MPGLTKLDTLHTEGNFISQIADLKKRIDALERQALKIDEEDFVLPVGGVNVRNGFLTLGDPGEVIIATGVIVVSKSYYLVDTEAAAAADNLDRIEGGVDGAILVLQAVNSTHTVTVREVVSPGNISLDVAGDFSLTHRDDTIMLIWNDVTEYWCELSRSDNTA